MANGKTTIRGDYGEYSNSRCIKAIWYISSTSRHSFDIPKGELVALLGPSGSGKTTLLRIIAGLEEADGGSISFDGEDLTDIHVKNRQVGFVFQHYALFKHMNVFENVAFGLKVRKKSLRPSAEAIEEKVTELLKLVKWMALLNVIQRNYLVDNVNVLH